MTIELAYQALAMFLESPGGDIETIDSAYTTADGLEEKRTFVKLAVEAATVARLARNLDDVSTAAELCEAVEAGFRMTDVTDEQFQAECTRTLRLLVIGDAGL